MEFFLDPTIKFGTKLLEVFYVLMGLMSIYAGVRNLRDKTNPARVGTFVFWCALGVVIAFGRWIPAAIDGGLVIVMVIPALLKQVQKGEASDADAPSAEEV